MSGISKSYEAEFVPAPDSFQSMQLSHGAVGEPVESWGSLRVAAVYRNSLTRIACVLFCACVLPLVYAPAVQAQTDGAVDGVTVKGERAYRVRGDQLQALDEVVRFPGGVEVNTNGTFKVADGKERKLKPGQVIRSDGWLSSPDGSIQPVFDHVIMRGGKAIGVRDGQASALTESMTFPNKLVVAPNGTCVYPDGQRSRLIEGQLVRLDGTSTPAKDAATLINGQVVIQRDGTLVSLASNQVMGMWDGTRVQGDGTMKKSDGTTTQLLNGQTVLFDGAVSGH